MNICKPKFLIAVSLVACLTTATTLESFAFFSPDTITVHNTTAQTVYVAPYLKHARPFKAKQSGMVETLQKEAKHPIKRPARKFGWDRRLLFTADRSMLEEKLNERAYAAIPRIPIGFRYGATFYLTEEDGRLVGYNARQWFSKKLAEKLSIPSMYEKIKGVFRSIIEIARSKVAPQHEHSGEVATVRKGSAVSPQEKTFIQTRKAKIKAHLEKILSQKYGPQYQELQEDDVPTIGLCFTGGGYRAMIASLGYLQGLSDIGMLDASLYMTGLSGSTWILAPWVLSDQPSIHQFAESFVPKMAVEDRDGTITELLEKVFAAHSRKEVLALAKLMLIKKINSQRIGFLDIYGAGIGNPLLKGYDGKEFYQHRLSHLQKYLSDGRFPMPILTAVEEPVGNIRWFEFNPYEVGSHNLGAYIPSWSLGCTFENGKSIASAQEQTLAYLLGICGSAYAVSLSVLVPHIIDNISNAFSFISKIEKGNLIRDLINEIKQLRQEATETSEKSLRDRKLQAARLANPTYKMPGMPLNQKSILELSDGGHACFLVGWENYQHNFASVPLLQPQRNVDMMIMCDSGRKGKTKCLRASVMQAEKEPNLLKQMPAIDFGNASLSMPHATVFKDENNLEKPIVTFAACIPDTTFDPDYNPAKAKCTSTLNFAWTKEEILRHSGLARHIIAKKESAEAIWHAIKWWIDQKRMQKSMRYA